MSHLTAAQRGNIETLLQEKYTNKVIARKLSKAPSTISREIKKGLDGNSIYHAWITQVAYAARHKPKHGTKRSFLYRCYLVQSIIMVRESTYTHL